MKKGQMLSQPFIFIFYLVVIAMILVFGVKVFSYLRCYDDRVEYHDFITRFESKISTIDNDAVGSNIGLSELMIPSDVDEICFFNYTRDYNNELDEGVLSDDLRAWMKIKLEAGDEDNVYIYSPKSCGDLELKSEKIDIILEDNFCEDLTDGEFNVVLESVPEGVSIELYTS